MPYRWLQLHYPQFLNQREQLLPLTSGAGLTGQRDWDIQVQDGTRFVMTPTKAGTYAIVCNEYCGIGHHSMLGRIYVK